MKRSLLFSLLLFPLLLPLAGCPAASTAIPPAAVAPGYIDAADQQMGQILAGARTFYNTVQCQTQTLNWSQTAQKCVADPAITTPMVLSATEKAAFNDFGLSLNAAETVHLGYHAGTVSLAVAQAAVNLVQQKQSALPALAVTQ